MKLVLGTVQFGMKYGVTNDEERPSLNSVFDTLDLAWNSGIRVLDTAQGYGEAIEIIAQYHAQTDRRFQVISKTLCNKVNSEEGCENVIRGLINDKQKMDIQFYEGVLLHHPPSINRYIDNNFLENVRHVAQVENVGVSINNPDDQKVYFPDLDIDIIQLPLNPLNAAFFSDDCLANLSAHRTKIHARSAFMQGLLISNIDLLPDYLSGLMPSLILFRRDCETQGISSLQACFLFLIEKKLVDSIVIGTQNADQLSEIISAYNKAQEIHSRGAIFDWARYQVLDFDLVNPSSWNLLKEKNDAATGR